jgi:hypothetical protein
VDATPEFCGRKDPRFERGDLTPEDLKTLAKAGEPDATNEDIVSAMEARTAQHVFCREFDAALKDLDLWPAGKREIEMKSLADAFAGDYPEFAAKLREMLKNK